MKERIAVLAGLRTPMGKTGGMLKSLSAVELGAHVVKEALMRVPLKPDEIDEVIMGNVAQPIDAANVTRVIALTAGLPTTVPAFTVHRNCASGMQALSSAAERILTANLNCCIAGGVETMTHIPFFYNEVMKTLFVKLANPRLSVLSKLSLLASFRLRFLKPLIGIKQGLTDPTVGLNMGETAEVLAKEFGITRTSQDEFALRSHQRAVRAQKKGIFAEEIHPLFSQTQRPALLAQDEGPRHRQTLQALTALKPYFDRENGTVTAGNACMMSDGAAALVLMRERVAKSRHLKPLGYIRAYAYAALSAKRMGLGPVFATQRLFKQTGMNLKQIDLVELNEAFAAQVLANVKAFASKQFAQTELSSPQALGELDPAKLNVNGGAIALGHPVGMSGARLVLHTLLELRRRKAQRGLATLCVGGGQGAAFLLEAA